MFPLAFAVEMPYRKVTIKVLLFWMVLFDNIFLSITSECISTEHKYSCSCAYETTNETVLVIEDHSLAFNFLSAIATVHHCSGPIHCKADFNHSQNYINSSKISYMICLSDNSCLLNSDHENSLSMTNDRNKCMKKSCLPVQDLIDFNVTNNLFETSIYQCIKIDPDNVKSNLCLKSACTSFVALEKPCVCDLKGNSCHCDNFCQDFFINESHNSYVLFLSFGDIFTTMKTKGAYLHWAILAVLCAGLVLLLVIFCRLCKAAVDPSSSSEIQNPDMLRHIMSMNTELASASTTAKSSFSTADRCSPPPTYEQVLKDKFMEFKKNVA